METMNITNIILIIAFAVGIWSTVLIIGKIICHTNCEFTVVLDDEPTLIEKLTVANYLKVLFSEFTWQEKPLGTIIIEPVIIKER